MNPAHGVHRGTFWRTRTITAGVKLAEWSRPLGLIAAAAVTTIAAGVAEAAPRRASDPATVLRQSLHEAVAAAWERLPQRQDFTAQQASAAARYIAGGTFVPNAPTAVGTYVNDKVAGSNYNYITSQVGVSTPLWLPGEGTATQNVAKADGASVTASVEAAHLALAAQVLDLASQATLAINARDVAARRAATDQALAADLARRFQVGESSQSDALAAAAEAAAASVTLQNAEAQLAIARLALSAITGTQAVPVLNGADTAAASVTVTNHPRVLAAEQAVAAAQANARLMRIADRDDPEIGLQGVNEKQPGTRWDTRFGVTVTFHFATEARNAPRRAAAEQVVTQAEVQLALVRREVTLAIRQADAQIGGYERASLAATRAAADLEKRRGQIERAWRLGEMPLIEVVRANAFAFDAAYARDKARIELDTARQRLRLAEGVLP